MPITVFFFSFFFLLDLVGWLLLVNCIKWIRMKVVECLRYNDRFSNSTSVKHGLILSILLLFNIFTNYIVAIIDLSLCYIAQTNS